MSRTSIAGICGVLISCFLSACRTAPQSGEESLIPPSFVNTNVWLGMPLWEAKSAYPKFQVRTITPRALLLGLDPSPVKRLPGKGVIGYMPTAIFIDEKLWGAYGIATFIGKSANDILTRAEYDQFQKDLVKECEYIYGSKPSSLTASKSAIGAITTNIVWQKDAYKATLVLPQTDNLSQWQLLGMVSVTGNKKKHNTEIDPDTKEMRELLGSMGLPVKQ